MRVKAAVCMLLVRLVLGEAYEAKLSTTQSAMCNRASTTNQQVSKQAGRQAGRQAGKQASKQASNHSKQAQLSSA